jgi:hypothetical protein
MESSVNREGWLLLDEISRGAGKRLRIAWSASRQCDRFIVESCLLGGSEPLPFIAGRCPHQV